MSYKTFIHVVFIVGDKSSFRLSVEGNSHLLWVCTTKLSVDSVTG